MSKAAEAARALVDASGKFFSRGTAMMLSELTIAVKGKREDICEAMLRELRERHDWPQGMEEDTK